jgi:sialic acid synthase SpsE
MKFIAEMCQNHLGSFEILERMVKEAKASGASHAKIQGIYVSELNFRSEFEDPKSKLHRPFDREFDRLEPLELSTKQEQEFVLLCKDIGIIPMITVFTHTGAERAEKNGFKSIKIASYDCASLPLIENCLRFASELVISTGATSWQGVGRTALKIGQLKTYHQSIALLHARTLYPCNLSEARLARISLLKKFGFAVGFSDHSSPMMDSLLTSKFAIAHGIEYLERHFTILEPGETKDGPVSVNPVQLQELVRFAESSSSNKLTFLRKNLEKFLASIVLDDVEPSELEVQNASYYRGRFVSIRNERKIFPWEEYSQN